MASFSTTLSALAAPRRSLPIAGVVAVLVAVQVAYGSWRAGSVPAAMSLGFLLLAPWSWRARLAHGGGVLAHLWYAGGGAVVVAVTGVALPWALGLEATFLTDPGSLGISFVLYLVGGWGLGRDLELEQSVEHLRLQAIRVHLDPHFLYNTLNAIAEWCREDAEVAEEATLRLAELLRDTLEALELRRWPLHRELALVRALLELHRVRDHEAFTFQLEIEPAAEPREVAPLLLVSIVENALKHGPRSGHRGVILVRVGLHGDGLRCRVENPGAFSPRPAHSGRGLATLRARLAFAYGGAYRFSLEPLEGERTAAVLELGRLRT